MTLEQLVYEAYDTCDWTKFSPPVRNEGARRLDRVQRAMTMLVGRLTKIRQLAEQAGNAEIIAILDGTEEKKT